MVIDISGAVFFTFAGLKKTPDVRTRHRWSEWTFHRNTSNIGRRGIFFFWVECTFLSHYYGLDPFQGSVIL